MGIPETWQYFDHTPLMWGLLVLAAMIVGFSKTGVAGMGILNPILFAMIFPAAESVGFLLPLLIMADVFAVRSYRKHTQWTYLFKSLPWVAIGIGVGYGCMRYWKESGALGGTYDAVMKLAIGCIVLSMMGLSLWINRHKDQAASVPRWLTPLFGLLTGFTTMLANAAGPVYSIFLLTFALPKHEFMGTRAMAFFLINWVKVPLQWQLGNITAESLCLNACLFPAIALGAWIGIRTLHSIPEKTFKLAVEVLVVAACSKLIVSAILVLYGGGA